MLPVVNGLQEQYGEQIAFVLLNAQDQDKGEEAFKALQINGHPASLIYQSEGKEVFRRLGSVPETDLVEAINAVLGA